MFQVLCAEDPETLQADAAAPQAYGSGGNVAAANYYPSQECYNVGAIDRFLFRLVFFMLIFLFLNRAV